MARPNPLTEPLEPYEPTSSFDAPEDYDWDYEGESARSAPMNIIWGRVAVLGGMLLLAFLLGRMTGGGEAGIPASELAAANDNVEALTTENDSLRADIAALQTQVAELESAAAAPVAEGEAAEPATTTEQPAGQNYTVKSGDTLSIIAEKFYNDASLDDYLAEFNEIADPTALSVGQVIFIPDEIPE